MANIQAAKNCGQPTGLPGMMTNSEITRSTTTHLVPQETVAVKQLSQPANPWRKALGNLLQSIHHACRPGLPISFMPGSQQVLHWLWIRNNLTLWGGITGVFIMPVYGLAVAYVNDYLEPEDIVPASGGLLIIYGASAATGPLLGSSAIGHFGPWALPVLFSIIGISVASFAMYRAGFGRRISIEEQGQFVAVPRTTPMAFELSPITDDVSTEDNDEGNPAKDETGQKPFDPHDLEDLLTPDGTAHPDDIGQVPAADGDETADPETDTKT